MTEDEAKTKWCPFVRFYLAGTDAPAYNRLAASAKDRKRVGAPESGPLMVSDMRCIASSCMAWRWYGTAHLEPDAKPEHFRGGCGLAGSVQP